MSSLLIALGFLLFAAASWQRREWGVYLIILLLPSYQIRFQLFGLPMTFLEGMILLLTGIELIWLVREKQLKTFWQNQFRQPVPRSVFILLFLAAATISVFVAPDLIKAAGLWKAFFIEPVVFFFLVLSIIDSKEKVRGLMFSLALLVLALSAFGVFQYLTLYNLPPSWWDTGFAERRITSLVNHPNALAHLLGPPLALLTMLFVSKPARLEWPQGQSGGRFSHYVLSAAVPLGFLTLFLSFSRAGWLAVFASLTLFGLVTQHRKKVLAAALLIVVLILLVPVSREKIISLTTGQDLSQKNRYVLWSAAADIIKKSPVLGVGLTGFREAYKNYPLGPDRVVQNYPHNFFLNFWVEIGLVGLAGMVGIVGMFYRQVFQLLKQDRALALAAAAAMAVILLHGQVDVPYFKNDLSVLFWTILALPFLSGVRS